MVGNYPLPPDIDLTEDAVFQGRDGFITAENHNLPWEEDKLANFTFRYVNGSWGNFEIVSDDLWTSNRNFDSAFTTRVINSTATTITTTNGTNQRVLSTSSNQLYYKTYSFNGLESMAYWTIDSYFEKLEDVFHKYYTEALGKEISPVYNKCLQEIDIKELIVQKQSDDIEVVDITELKVDYEKIAREYFINSTVLRRKVAYQEIGIPFSPYEPDKDTPDDLTSFTGLDHGRFYKNVLPWEESDSGENIFRIETNDSINTTVVDTSIISESLESLVNQDDVEVFIA